MSKVIVTTNKLNRRNLTCIIAGIIVAFDVNLQAHVDEEDLQYILEADQSIDFDGKEKYDIPSIKTEQEKVQADFVVELSKAAGVDVEETDKVEVEETEEDKLTEVTDIEFDELTVSALKDVAREANLPSSEWNGLRRNELVAYLKSKL